jgi:hypothetical protein
MTKRVIAVVAGVAGLGGLLAGAAALGGSGVATQSALSATDYTRCMNTGQAGNVTTGLRASAKQDAAKHTVCGVYMLTGL